MKVNTQKVKELLNRGVEEIISKSHLSKRLKSGEKLRVKFGIDPTAPDLHLGHFVLLRKLRQFQDLGHKVVFLIGDFTAKIGDPSGRMETRKPLTDKEIKEDMKDYVEQASKVLDMKKVEIRHNSEWYKKKRAMFLMDLASRFTFARVAERDDFKKRLKEGLDVGMLELIYPLLQGYDSVELKADVEVGGRDQKFNLLMGRKVQKRYGQLKQDVITTPLLEGTDGVRKMSKSYGNYISLTASPSEMFGQIMSISDNLIWKYFNLLTDIPEKQIENLKEKVLYKKKISPKEAKAQLSREVVAGFYGKKEAEKAEKEFNKVFKDKEIPEDVPEFKIKEKKIPILDLLVKTDLASSKSEAKRVIEQGGVKINGEVQKDWKKEIEIERGMIIKVGKRRFAKVK